MFSVGQILSDSILGEIKRTIIELDNMYGQTLSEQQLQS